MIQRAFYKLRICSSFFRVEGAGTCIWPLGCICCRSLEYMARCRDAPSILCLVFKHRNNYVKRWRMCKVVRNGQKKKYGFDRSAERIVWFIISLLYCRLCTPVRSGGSLRHRRAVGLSEWNIDHQNWSSAPRAKLSTKLTLQWIRCTKELSYTVLDSINNIFRLVLCRLVCF